MVFPLSFSKCISWHCSNPQKQDAEQVIEILPTLHQLKSGSQSQSGKARQRVLVRVFCGDVFFLLETDLLLILMHHLWTCTHQVHLDSAQRFVVGGVVAER